MHIPLSFNSALILRCSEHFCRPSHLMTVDRLMLWNTEEVLRPSAGVSQGGGKKATQDRQKKVFRWHFERNILMTDVFLSPKSLLNVRYVAGGCFCCHIPKATYHLFKVSDHTGFAVSCQCSVWMHHSHVWHIDPQVLPLWPCLPYTPCGSPSFCALNLEVFHFIFQTS